MAMYLGNMNKPGPSQMMSATLMQKNKIAVNVPKQTHFTVEGVQAYAPQEIKALREREERIMGGKEGTFAPLKVVLLSDQMPLLDDLPSEQKTGNLKVKQNAKRPQSSVNVRNAVSANNQAIVKLEKEIGKRDALQRKLESMSDKYKEYFRSVDLKERMEMSQKQKENQGSQEQQQNTERRQKYLDTLEEHMKSQPDDSPSIAEGMEKVQRTTNYKSQKTKKPSKQKEKEEGSEVSDSKLDQNENNSQFFENSAVKKGFDLNRQCTSYSERLGTAIHDMFS